MLRLAALFAFLLPQVADAAVCEIQRFEDTSFTACEVRVGEDLRLFHSGPSGPLGSFNAVNAALAAEGKTLGFAMNAGMYHPNRAPVGLLIEQGSTQSDIVTAQGPGNFGLLPNGVFCIGERFSVVESRAFSATPPKCSYATQSGPMLVIDGALHPRLIPDSDSTFIRNGVGVSADGTRAVFVISNDRVNFHRFARFFRDALGLPDALYFDGKISRLYAPAVRRNDLGFAMGPMVGTVVNKD
ncbi:phosphodiester glycosidase family protein [Pseudotabrizicola sp.]|uniref:phosphodiester glycosidase family protein n=1 Tax=Pseudotabrizicola sp. TaxID=2939647 RepID=UPI002724C3C3|nr:phosphodiester glycosidase family protein [Pseudotabrizicola sp.]MDO8883162.1 phosphodiester glycosidase family protein [Pseudotabrizicola sp.]